MPSLRSIPHADALAAAHRSKAQQDLALRAAQAFDRRVAVLEEQQRELQHRLKLISRAIPWLPRDQRDGARARLLALGGADLEPFELLRLDLNGHERTAAPSTGRPGAAPDAAVAQRRRQVAQLRRQGLHATAIAARLGVRVDQVRHDLRALKREHEPIAA